MSGHNTGAVLEGKITRRGTSNSDVRGSSHTRRRRREWLIETYRADVDVLPWIYQHWTRVEEEALTGRTPQAIAFGAGEHACRCYRCGKLLTVDTVTVDRIIPGCQGGSYRRDNIRPACGSCNSETGGPLAGRQGKR